MMRLRNRVRRDERGAALILAIAFLVVIGAIGAATISSVTSGVKDRVVLDNVRNRQYAADGAIEGAIAQVRTRMTSGTTPYCNAYATTLNGVSITVDCVPVQTVTLSGLAQRNATFTAHCTSVSLPKCPNAIQPIIRAQVNFESSSPITASALNITDTYIQSWVVYET